MVIAWSVASRLVGAQIILPAPAATIAALWAQIRMPSFYGHVLATVIRTFTGFAFALVVGSVWGVVAGLSRRFEQFLRPALALVRATPVIAVILLALIWFRANIAPVFVTILMVLPVVVENAVAGTRSASGSLLEMARSFGVPRRRVLHLVIFPSLRPYLSAAVHSGLGMAYKVTVAAEVIIQPPWSLGGSMQEARFYLDTPRILALTIVVIVLAALTEAIADALNRLVPPPSLRSDPGTSRAPDRATSAGGATAVWTRTGSITLAAVSKAFEANRVIDDLSLRFESGEVTVVLGPSGCGKTTLLRLIAGAIDPDSGSVTREGGCAMAFQEARLLPWSDAGTNVRFVLEADAPNVDAWLERVGLPGLSRAFPATLSGGMQQRVALVRALCAPGETLLLDEPLQNLDLPVKLSLAALIRESTRDGDRTTVMVTHDVVEAIACADRIVQLGGSPVRPVADVRVPQGEAVRDPRTDDHLSVARALYDAILSMR